MAKNILLVLFFLKCKLYVDGFNVDINFPIIFKDPSANKSDRSSYFGYSVLLNNSWILIGAPRANYSSVKLEEPGVTYQCEFKESCREIHLKEAERASKNKNEAKGYTNAWFGVAMDQSPSGQTMVCGHRWRLPSGRAKLPGACYWFQDDKNVKFIRPIPGEKREDVKYQIGRNVYFKTSMSQSGIAVHIFPSSWGKGGVFFGSPGYLDWRGSVVHHAQNINGYDQNRAQGIASYGFRNEIQSYSYLGYHVSSGCFRKADKCLLVVGAPRGQNYHKKMTGFVALFNLPEKNDTFWTYYHSTSPPGYKVPDESRLSFSLVKKVHGEQEGEYFGSSFAVTDFDGDGRDDLIVGAPFYSLQGDEGRIYMFRGHQESILTKASTANGRREGGRFGTAVVSVGDLDRDGFQDVAVGAPFEGHGAIYIFYGNSNGSIVSSKRIAAEELSIEIRGFGISISGMADVDNNKYKDLAVGAFLSGHVVILRSRPVVTLKTRIKPHIKRLSTEKTVKIEMCLLYEGKDVPKSLNVTRKISVDESYKRARPHYKEDEIILRGDFENCENISFSISNDKGILKPPLKIKLSQELLTTTTVVKQLIYHKSDADKFDLQGPVLVKSLASEESIPFKIDCGPRNCTVRLNLTCSLSRSGQYLNETFVIGKYDTLQLQITATNIGDLIYSSIMKVKLPEGISLEKTTSSCDDAYNNIQCEHFNIRDSEHVTLDLDMTNLQFYPKDEEDIQYVQINVTANSTADGIQRTENSCSVPLSITVNASVGAYGKPQKDIYPLTRSDTMLEMYHVYEIYKEGYSPIREFEIDFYLPSKIFSFKGLTQILAFDVTDVNIQCVGQKPSFFEQSENSEQEDQGIPELIRMRRSVDSARNHLDVYIPPSDQTLYLNCSSKQDKLCEKIVCRGTELHSRTLQLKLLLNITKLRPEMGQKNIIFLTTEAYVKILKPEVKKRVFHVAASSAIIGVVQEIKLALWVYVASGVGGILLLMLLAMGLAKAGFFQRTKRAELEALMQRETETEAKEMACEDQEDLHQVES